MFIVNVILDGWIYLFGKFNFCVDLVKKYRLGYEKEVIRKLLVLDFVFDFLVIVNYWNNLVVMYNIEGDYDKFIFMFVEFDIY